MQGAIKKIIMDVEAEFSVCQKFKRKIKVLAVIRWKISGIIFIIII